MYRYQNIEDITSMADNKDIFFSTKQHIRLTSKEEAKVQQLWWEHARREAAAWHVRSDAAETAAAATAAVTRTRLG